MVVCLPHSRCPITGMLLRTRIAALLCEPHATSQQALAAEIPTHSSLGLITSLKTPLCFDGRSHSSSTWHHFYDLAYNPWQHRHGCVSEEGAWEGPSVGAPVLGQSGRRSHWEFFISLGIQFYAGSRAKVSKCEGTSQSSRGLLNAGSWASSPKVLTYGVGIMPRASFSTMFAGAAATIGLQTIF